MQIYDVFGIIAGVFFAVALVAGLLTLRWRKDGVPVFMGTSHVFFYPEHLTKRGLVARRICIAAQCICIVFVLLAFVAGFLKGKGW
jgi:hypothetical protein